MRDHEEVAYPFAIPNMRESGLPYIEPLAMWRAILGDLILGTPAPVMAARFHKGLAKVVVAMAEKLAVRDEEGRARFETIALSGGCFQNRVLFEEVVGGLERDGLSRAHACCKSPPTTADSRSGRPRSAPRVSLTQPMRETTASIMG